MLCFKKEITLLVKYILSDFNHNQNLLTDFSKISKYEIDKNVL